MCGREEVLGCETVVGREEARERESRVEICDHLHRCTERTGVGLGYRDDDEESGLFCKSRE
jgi:hypothetical protein